MRTLTLLVVAAALTGSLVRHADAGRDVQFCRGTALTGRFAVVPGSAGAGNIVYKLELRNQSATACSVTGTPVVSLRGKRGAKLPTHVRSAFPGAQTAILVTLAPNQKTVATARFSPDVPGVGEGHVGACEPRAYRLVVTPNGGGTTAVPILPATPVCEHGSLTFSLYSHPQR